MKTIALVALGLFICVAGEEDSGHRRCSGYCKERTKFWYEPGHTYLYDYRVDTNTGISKTTKEESRLHLSAVAEIAVLSPCDFRLQLRDVLLEDSLPEDAGQHSPVPRMAELIEALERHPLLFSFQDGRIEELCPSSDDSAWVLNIKRGVLSAFQNSMNSFEDLETAVYEKDVTGMCETTYTSSSTEFPTVIMKTKDLLSCTHRLDHYLSFPSTPYNSPINVHSLPLIKSQHSCKQNIGATGLLERAICSETHVFRPFSNGENGAVTRVLQYLIYKKMFSHIQPENSGPAGPRTTLLFQHNQQGLDLPDQEHMVMRILEDLSMKTKDGVEGEVPRLFSQLVKALKTLQYPQLSTLFSNTQQSPLRKFLLDAMPLVGTPDGVAVMIDLYGYHEISDSDLDSWLTSLAFQKKPSSGMLAAISALLDNTSRPKAVLTASSLVHSFCLTQSTCNNKVVKEIMLKIEHLLGDHCAPKDEKHMELIIVALKGIGNAGVIINSLKTLRKCYEMDNPTEVRLAAIEAHRRLPCDVAPRDHFLFTFMDVQHKRSTEIRIAAYLELMKCPTLKSLQDIKDMLYKEEVNQVASFVWTHLTNLQETSSRWKQGIKALISNEFLKNKFSTDVRKYSRNYEVSKYFDSLSAGAGVESNIIFTPESYLPRSATLNLTLDLFGESFNVLELGGRAEGFENTIENMFSSGGYLPDETVKNFLENYRQKSANDLDSSIDKLSIAFDAKGRRIQEPKASMYARVFGNELVYNRFNALENMLRNGGDDTYKDYMIKLALGEGTEYMKSFSLLDASYVLPTAVGLPLEFAVNGSATVGLKYSGLITVKEMTKGALSVSGELTPSAAVEVTGTMSVRAFSARAGITSVNRLNTNTYLGGAVKIVHGKVADIKINVPRDKMEILDVSTKLFMIHKESPHEIKGIVADREVQEGCSPDVISDILGMKLCGELSYPNASQIENAPYFPLTGPFALRFSLIKTDTFNFYEFGYKFNPDPKVSSLNIHFDSVGSQIDRKVQFLGVYDRKKTSVSVNLRSPAFKLVTSGMITNTPDAKGVDVSLSVDNVNLFEIHAGFQTSERNNVGVYKPSIKLVYKDKSYLDVSGNIHYIDGVKYSVSLKIKSQLKPIFIRGDLKVQPRAYSFTANIHSSFINGNIEGAVRKVSDYVGSHARIQYSLLETKEQFIEITNKLLLSRKGDAELRSLQSSAKFSEYPGYDFDVNWELQRGYKLFSHSLSWTFGGSTWETSQVYRNRILNQHTDFQLLGMLTCEQNGIDYKLDIKHQTTDISVVSHAIAHLGTNHKYIASFEYLNNDENTETLAVELSYSGLNATVNGRIQQTTLNVYDMFLEASLLMNSASLSKQQQHSLKLGGTYTDRSYGELQDHIFHIRLTGGLNGELLGALQASETSIKQWLQVSACNQTFREDINYVYDGLHNFDVVVQLANRNYKGKAIISNTEKVRGVVINLDFSTKFTFSAEMKKHEGEDFSTFESELTWNLETYPNNRIYLIAESLGVKKNFTLEYPGKKINGELISQPDFIKAQLQWHPTKKISTVVEWMWTPEEANLFGKLETPWRGLETQSLAAEYKTGPNPQLQVEMMWQKEKLAFLAHGGRSIISDGVWFSETNLNITSTIRNWENLNLNINCTHGQYVESNIEFIRGTQHSSMMVKYKAGDTRTTAGFSLTSPWFENPINGKLIYKNDEQSYSSSFDFRWAPYKQISGNVIVSTNSRTQSHLKLTTPFEGYERFIIELLFRTNSPNPRILSKISINDHLSLFLFDKSVTQTYGKLVTPFNYPLELTIEQEMLHDMILMQHNGQEVMKYRRTGGSIIDKKLQLLFELNLPHNIISVHVNNIAENKKSQLQLEGKWNSETLSVSLSSGITERYSEFQLFLNGQISGSFMHAPMELHFHHITVPNAKITLLQIPGGINMTHNFYFENLFQWKNIFSINTPWKSGLIVNTQELIIEESAYHHNMTAEVNGKQSQLQVWWKPDERFQNVSGELSTPWSDPVTLQFVITEDEDTNKAHLIIGHKQKVVNLVMTHTSQHQKEFFTVQMESPYHDDISLTMVYDAASSSKNVFVKTEWAMKALELDSHLRFDKHDGFLRLVVKGPNREQEILKCMLNYDLRYESKFIDLTGALGGNEIQGKFNQLIDSYELNTSLKTVFKNWENVRVSSHVNLNKLDNAATLEIIRNTDIMNFTCLSKWDTNYYTASIKANNTFFSLPSVSLDGTYDRRSSNNQVISIVYNHNGTVTELTSKLDHDTKNFVDAGALEIIMKTPIESLKFLKALISYNNKNEKNQQMKLLLTREEWKLQIDGESMFDDSGSQASLNLLLPFQDVQTLSASLNHKYVSNREQTLNILISCNNKNVEIGGHVISYGNELSANLEIITPVVGYENISGDFNIAGIIRKKKSFSLNLAVQHHSLQLSGDLSITNPLEVDGSLSAQLPNNQKASAGLSYNLLRTNNTRKHADFYLIFPKTKYELNAFFDRQNEGNIVARLSINSPILSGETTGSYEAGARILKTNITIMRDQMNEMVRADLNIQPNLFSLNFISPATGYEKLSVEGKLDWKSHKQSVNFLFTEKSNEYKVSLLTTRDSRIIETRINMYTPVPDWEEVNIHGLYNFSSDTEEEVKLVAVKGQQSLDIVGNWYFDGQDIQTSLYILQTSLGTLDLTANFTSERSSIRVRGIDNNGRKTLESFIKTSKSDLQVVMQSVFPQLQNINLTVVYSTVPTMEFINTEFQYKGIGTNSTLIWKLKIRNDRIYIMMDPFVFDSSIRNFSITFLLRHSFTNLADTSLSLETSINGSNLFKILLDLNNELENKLGANFTVLTDGKSVINAYAWSTPSFVFPPTELHLILSDHSVTYVNISHVLVNINRNGFTYNGHLNLPHNNMSLLIEFNPDDMVINTSLNISYDYGLKQEYEALMTLNKEKQLNIKILTPILGYDEFSLTSRHGPDFVDVSLKTPFISLFSGEFRLMKQNKKLLTLSAIRNGSTLKMNMSIQNDVNFMDISLDVVTPFHGFEKLNFNSSSDFKSSKKVHFTEVNINGNIYHLKSEFIFGNLSASGVLNISTPIPNFQKPTFILQYDLLSSVSKILVIQGEVNKFKYLDVNVELIRHAKKGRVYINSQLPVKDILFTYDFSDFIKGHTISTNMNIYGAKLNTKINYKGNEGQNKGKIEATLKKADSTQWSTDIYFRREEKDAAFSWNLKAGTLEWKAKLDRDFHNRILSILDVTLYGRKLISCESSLEQVSAGFLKSFSLTLESYFEDFKLYSFITHDEALTSKSGIEWGEKIKTALTGSFHFMPHNIHNEISFTRTNSEPLTVNFDCIFTAPNQSFEFILDYGFKALQMKGTYSNGELNVTAETPFQGYSHLQLNVQHSHNSVLVRYQHEKYLTQFVAQLMKTDFMLSLVTPLEMLKEFTLNGKFTNPTELSTTARVLWGNEKYFIGLIEFSPKYSRLQINSTLQHSKFLDIHFNVTENHIMNKFDLVIGYGTDIITATINVNNQNLVIELQMPWTESIKIQGYLHREDGRMDLLCQYGQNYTVLEAEYIHNIENNNLHVREFQAILPKAGKLNIHVVTSPMYTKVDFTQKSDTASWKFSLEMTRNKEHLQSVFSLETPFKSFKKANVHTELHFLKKYALLIFNNNDEVYKVESSINFTDSSLESKLSIESPHFSMTDASLLLSYDETSLDVSMEALKQKIVIQSSYDITELDMMLNVMLETPFLESLDKTLLSVSVNAKNLTSSLRAVWMNNSVSMTANLNPQNFIVNLQTPFKILENFQLYGKLSTETNHNFVATLSWAPVMLTLNTSANLKLNDYSVYSIIEWAHDRHMTMVGYLQFPNLENLKWNFNSSLSSPLEGTIDYHATFQLQKVAYSEYRSDVNMFAPFIGNVLSSLVYSFNQNGTFSLNWQTSLSNDSQVSIRVALDADDPYYTHGNLIIKEPFQIFSEIGLRGEIDEVRNTADFQLRISQTIYKFSTSCLLVEGDIKMVLKLQLPGIIYLEGSIKHNHQKGEVSITVYDNHFFSSYEVQQSFLYSRMDLSLPLLNMQEAGLYIAANYSSSRSNGSIIYKYQEYQSKIMFSLRRNPVSLHNKKSVLSKVNLSHFSAVADYHNGEYSKHASLIIENVDKELNVVVKLISHQSSLRIRKSDGYTNLMLGDWVKMELLAKSNEGFIHLSWPTHVHKLKYSIELNNGVKATVEIESPFLTTGKRDIQLTIEELYSKIQSTLTTKSGSFEHSLAVDVDFGNQKQVKMSLSSSNFSSLILEISVEKHKFSVNAEYSIGGWRNYISVTHKKTFPFDSRVRIESQVLFSEPIEVALIANEPFLISVCCGKHFVLEANLLLPEGKANFLLKTPTLLSFEVGGEFIANTDEIKLITSLNLNKPSIDAALKFHFTANSLDSHIKLLTPIRNHEHYEGRLYIPFSFNSNIHLNCSLILPSVKYEYSATVRQQEEIIEFISLNQHRDKLANLTFKLEYGTRFVIYTEINTPFPGFTHYCLDLEGQKNLKDGNDIVNYIEWGNKKIELRYSFIIEMNQFMTQVQLRTPFKNYDHYAMRIQFENHARKLAVASIMYPGLDSPVGIKFDYLYKNVFDINLITQFNIPFFPGFQKASFSLGNKLNFAEGSYQAIISGFINEKKLLLNIDGLMNSEEAKLEILAQQNDKEIYLKALSAFDDVLYQLTALFELQTPLPVIKNTKFSLVYGPNLLQIVTSYNSREILALDAAATHSLINFELRNPIRPVSFRFEKKTQDNLVVFAEICWDLNNRIESQLGFEYTVFLSWKKQEIKTKLKFPTRTILYDFKHNFVVSSAIFEECLMQFSWEDGKTIGYHFLSHQDNHILSHEDYSNYTIFGRLDFPFRSLEGSVQRVTGKSEYKKGEFLWDAADNRDKRIGYELSTAGSTVKYRFFAHDALFEIKQNYKTLNRSFPFETQVDIGYSPYPEDTFTLRMLHDYHDSLAAGLSVHHKPSLLHFDSTLELSNHDEVIKSKLNITYMKPSNKQKTSLVSFVKTAILKPEIEIQFLTNENSISIGGLMWSRGSGYNGLSVHCQMNQKEPITLSTAISFDKTASEVELHYGKQRHYTLSGHFPNWQEISAETSHSLNEVITQDGLMVLKLNTSHLFWTRIEWSSKILDDIRPDILQEYADITYVVKAIGQNYLELLNEEFQISFPDITMNGILDYIKAEISDIKQEFQVMTQDVFTMYERNDFFLKDICHILRSSCSQLYNILAAMGKSMTDMIETVTYFTKNLFVFLWDVLSMDYLLACASDIITRMQEMLSVVPEWLKLVANTFHRVRELLRDLGKRVVIHLRLELVKLRQNLHQISQEVSFIVMDHLNLLGIYVERLTENLEHHISYLQVEAMIIVLEAADVIEDISMTFLEIPEVQYLIETYARYASWLEEFHLQDHIDKFIDAAAEAVDLLVNDVMKALNHIKTLLLGSTQPYLNSVDQMPMPMCIRTAINEMYQKVVWFWNYYEITNQILNGLDSVLDESDSMLLNVITGMDSEVESKTDLVFRPDIGLVEYTQELPVEWNGFNELPKFEQFSWNPKDHKPQEQLEKLDKYSYAFFNPLNTAVNKTLKALLPPFSKHAVIAGKHFFTFDNKFYNFEGDCSYLLASDFSNNKFSAVINYEIKNHQVVKSLTVITEGHHILLGSNHRVSVDGIKTELPVQVSRSTWVTRTGERILVSTTFGMEIECNVRHDICTMTLAGWYFGKTGGLLGTFDNEPSNDLSLPDGTVTSDINNFANSWRVGNEINCQLRSEVADELEQVAPFREDSTVCASYFQRSSSLLGACFSHIDPQPYYNMCLQDGGCLSAVTYVTQCKKMDIDVLIPPECVNCPLSDGSELKAGEGKVFLNGTVQLADVVLVVEQASCLKSVRLTDAVTKLDSALKAKGISDAQYSVVGFGGDNFVLPHTRTANGKVWTTRKLIDKALNSLQFEVENSNDDVSVYEALWYAARLSFRAGVSKTIVLIQCNACNDPGQTNDYNDMLRLLHSNGITLHVLQPDIVKLDASPEKTAKLFGMDVEGTYSARNLANLTPKKNLLKQVTLPKDLCVPLALETNGTAFNLNHMLGEKARGTSKRFLDVWSRRLAKDTLPAYTQKCQCVADQDLVGRMMCAIYKVSIHDSMLEDFEATWLDEDTDYDF